MKKIKTVRNKIMIGSLMMGFLAAAIKGRQVQTMAEAMPTVPVSPLRLSRSELRSVFSDTFRAIGSKNLPTLAAGIAYYSTLALFPLLAASVAIAALIITSDQLDLLIKTAGAYLPADISNVISSQLQSLVSRRTDNIIAAAIAVALALFGASGASKNLVIGGNVAYGVKESRGWIAQQAWGVFWTAGGILFGLFLVVLLAFNSAISEQLSVSPSVTSALLYGRWMVLIVIVVFGLSVFYRFGPNRPNMPWQWVDWGALLATLIWIVATLGFFTYVQHFAHYSQSYSFFAGIIALMIWMNLSALIILVGAEFNNQLSRVNQK